MWVDKLKMEELGKTEIVISKIYIHFFHSVTMIYLHKTLSDILNIDDRTMVNLNDIYQLIYRHRYCFRLSIVRYFNRR